MRLNKSCTIITQGNEFRQSLASHADVLGERRAGGWGGGGVRRGGLRDEPRERLRRILVKARTNVIISGFK